MIHVSGQQTRWPGSVPTPTYDPQRLTMYVDPVPAIRTIGTKVNGSYSVNKPIYFDTSHPLVEQPPPSQSRGNEYWKYILSVGPGISSQSEILRLAAGTVISRGLLAVCGELMDYRFVDNAGCGGHEISSRLTVVLKATHVIGVDWLAANFLASAKVLASENLLAAANCSLATQAWRRYIKRPFPFPRPTFLSIHYTIQRENDIDRFLQ